MRVRKEGSKVNKKSKIRFMWNITVFILLFFAIIMVSYMSLNKIKSFFTIRSILFYGNKHMTDDELKLLAGIRNDDNLITVSEKKVCEKLLRSPWIRSVSVRKELPHTLTILIQEVTPFALLEMNNQLFIINEKGDLLEELKDDPIPFLPVIRANPYKESNEWLSEALSLARSMNELGFPMERNQIEIIVSKPQELTAVIDGTVVKVGSGEYNEKLKRLLELEEEIKRRNIPVDFIDLRFENRVVVKPVKEVIR